MRENGEILFDFYGLVSLSVQCPPRIAGFLRSEWGAFSAAGPANRADITARWASSARGGSGMSPQRLSRRTGGWYKGCFWRAIVSESQSGTTVDYVSMPRSGFLFKDSCIEPLLLSRLAERGLQSLHASSLLIGKNAWIFCGSPGSGKTVLGLLGAAAGHTLLSDDISFVRDGRALGYPVPPRISPRENLDHALLRDLLAREVPRELVLSHLVSSSTLGNVRIPTRLIRATGGFGPAQSNVGYPIGGFLFMKTGRGPPVIEPLLDREYAIQEGIKSWPLHGGSILSNPHSIGNGGSSRREALTAEIGVAADSQRCFGLRVPAKASAEDWRTAFRKVEAVAQEID